LETKEDLTKGVHLDSGSSIRPRIARAAFLLLGCGCGSVRLKGPERSRRATNGGGRCSPSTLPLDTLRALSLSKRLGTLSLSNGRQRRPASWR
jgi:hypothetical protein